MRCPEFPGNPARPRRALRLPHVSRSAQSDAFMTLKRRLTGSFLAAIGFMLSPLSWWNDAFVNLPLALAFAWLLSWPFAKSWKETVFNVSVIVGYWLTNVLGFVLMHKGARQIAAKENDPP